MEWMIYLLGGIALGAGVLAVYERRKNLRLTQDAVPQDMPQDRERTAYTESQRIAAQSNPTQMPGNF